jgi:hypothetical protein
MNPRDAWLLLLILTIACALPPVRAALAASARWIDRIARAHGGGELLVFVVCAAIGSIPTLLGVNPPPNTPDEFSYLLAADTFAHGRLTNPRHELWEHFETLHVLVTPTYASKYPPALGLTMALGQAIAGEPIVGAWLCSALAAAASTWMLRVWTPPRWAVQGGLLAGLHPQVYWLGGQTYWGASPAMLGGALLVGAAARTLRRRPRAWHGVAGAGGIAILAISRSHEGLILTVLVATWVTVSALRRAKLRAILRATAVPAAVVTAGAGAWMAYYNWRVTRDPFELPYTLYAKQYQIAPLFTWQSPRPTPEYRHPRIAEYWTVYDRDEWVQQARAAPDFIHGATSFVRGLIATYLAPASLWAALIGLPLALWRRRAARVALTILVAFVLLHIATTWWKRMHYVMPAVPLFVAVVVMSLRELARLKLGRLRVGAALAGAVVIVQLVMPWLITRNMWVNPSPPGSARARLIEQLKTTPGDHLVLVEYAPGPQQLFEWVYNDADIDASRVVFAHPIDESSVLRLLDYYPKRRVWRLVIEADRFSLNEVPR